jgi:hypothetical protein
MNLTDIQVWVDIVQASWMANVFETQVWTTVVHKAVDVKTSPPSDCSISALHVGPKVTAGTPRILGESLLKAVQILLGWVIALF